MRQSKAFVDAVRNCIENRTTPTTVEPIYTTWKQTKNVSIHDMVKLSQGSTPINPGRQPHSKTEHDNLGKSTDSNLGSL